MQEDKFVSPVIEYISLADASVLSGISRDYLNVLIRRGKLRAVKVGKNWLTTKSWVSECRASQESKASENEYLSLFSAAKLAGVTPGYLNVAVRRGKLKAAKLGRNWFTTKEWLEDYQRAVGRIEQAYSITNTKTEEKHEAGVQVAETAAPEATTIIPQIYSANFDIPKSKSLNISRFQNFDISRFEVGLKSRTLTAYERAGVLEKARIRHATKVDNRSSYTVHNFVNAARREAHRFAWSDAKIIFSLSLVSIFAFISIGMMAGFISPENLASPVDRIVRIPALDQTFRFTDRTIFGGENTSANSSLTAAVTFTDVALAPFRWVATFFTDMPDFLAWVGGNVSEGVDRTIALFTPAKPEELAVGPLPQGTPQLKKPEELAITPEIATGTPGGVPSILGTPAVPGQVPTELIGVAYDNTKLPLGGGTITGNLTVKGQANLQSTTTVSSLVVRGKSTLNDQLVFITPDTWIAKDTQGNLVFHDARGSKTLFQLIQAALAVAPPVIVQGAPAVITSTGFTPSIQPSVTTGADRFSANYLSVASDAIIKGSLTVSGNGSFNGLSASGNASIGGTLSVTGNTTLSNLSVSSLTVGGTGTTTFAGPITSASGNFIVAAASSNAVLINPYGGSVGIGTTSPGSLLSVGGSGYFSGNLTVSGTCTGCAINGGSAGQIPYISAPSVLTPTSTIFLATNGNVGIGTTSPATTLEVIKTSSGATADQLYLTNASSATSSASRLIFRADDIGGANVNLGSVAGILTQNWATGAALGQLAFSTLNAGTLTEAMRITDTGNVGIGTTTFSQALTVAGSGYFSGNLTVSGNATVIGASSANTLTVNSSITSNLIPDQNITRNLGSPALYWNNAYIGTVTANNISAASTTIAGTQSKTFTIDSGNVSADQDTQNLIFFRGTVVPNALLTWNSATSSKRFEFNQALYIDNGSASTTNPTLTIQTIANQTANGLQVIDNNSNNLFSVNPVGSNTTIINASTTNATLPTFWSTNGTITTGTITNGTVTNASTTYLTVSSAAFFPGTGIWNSSGDVGIGTTTPGSLLSVNSTGNVYFGGNLTVSGSITAASQINLLTGSSLLLPDGTAAAPALAFTADTGTGLWRPGTSKLAFSTGGTERVRIDAGGDLLIGTTSTAFANGSNRLDVKGAIAIRSGSNQINLGDGNSVNGFISYSSANLVLDPEDTSSSITLKTDTGAGNPTTAVIINSNQNVGIGTTSAAFANYFPTTGNGLYNRGLAIFQTATGQDSGNTQAFQFQNLSGTTILDVDTQNSRVGVGTTTPGSALSVNGNTYVGGTLTVSGASTLQGALTVSGLTSLQNATTTAFAVTGSATTTFGGPVSSASGNFIVAANSANNILLNPYGGNVGIGTTTPNNLLTVFGATTPAINITTNAGLSGWTFGIDTADQNKFKIASSTGSLTSNTRLTIDGNGNVGLGTASPNAALQISNNTASVLANASTTQNAGIVAWRAENDNTSSAASIYNQFNNGTTNAYWYLFGSGYTASGAYNPNGATLESAGGGGLSLLSSASNGNIYFFTGGNASSTNERMIITSGGNVGIGTTTPGTAFALNGNGYIGGTLTVTGQCVTGDTKLIARRRRRRKNAEGDIEEYYDEPEEIEIKNIAAGDLVLSLNEKTGKMEFQKVRGLLDMGVKPVYKITTESGRTIITTANHPYRTKWGWRKIMDLAVGDEILVTDVVDLRT